MAALFLTVAGEPSVEEAIRLEHAAAPHAPNPDDPHGGDGEIVSRGVQKGAGLFAAYAVTGAGFGLLLAAGFTATRRRWPDPFGRALRCGAALAAALTVSPWVKYPPNPPAVGDPATLARRQAFYVAVIVLTVAVLAAAAWLAERWQAWPPPRRVAAVAAAVAVLLLVVWAVLPPAPDPVTVPATLVWRFRLASLGGNLLLWAGLTLGFGVWASERRPVPEVVAA